MANQFNILQLFENAFGTRVPETRFEIPQADSRTLKSSIGSPLYGEDIYGREFFMPITITYTPKGASAGLDYHVPFAVVSISCRKVIVETPLVERTGTVKELVSADDYDLNIKGIIVRPDNNWPDKEIMQLEELFTVNKSIVIRSALTDIFLKGDYEHHIVIKRINLPANPGVEHAKPFELESVSDAIFTLDVE